MDKRLSEIIKYLIGFNNAAVPGLSINIRPHFLPGDSSDAGVLSSLNASFLIMLAGQDHPDYERAATFLDRMSSDPRWSVISDFYRDGVDSIHHEISGRCIKDDEFDKALSSLCKLTGSGKDCDSASLKEGFWRVFCPEACGIISDRELMIRELRKKRTIRIDEPAPALVSNPSGEILFTSNILLTVPLNDNDLVYLSLTDDIKQEISDAAHASQKYWYDHPIPIGIAPGNNEILHGLEGLDAAVDFEKSGGRLPLDARLTCALSVSVTHSGLRKIARDYIESELQREKDIRHLDIFVFTEAAALKILDEILIPAAGHYRIAGDIRGLKKVFGVDGEYGRHYSFLKALAAFWHVLISSDVRATFKIDLDQVFPQKELVQQSGMSAFGHFRSGLWGSMGTDASGRPVELGLIAGSLVNCGDEKCSIFTPDVKFPEGEPSPDELIFFSKLPHALSTEAEMMTQYGQDGIDGTGSCIQRIHVTGGTNGILIDALRRHRPFTPSVIGRAEDQAYILSVLFSGDRPMRYVHKDGLVMRHDKKSFAADAVKAAESGKLIGDYIRILVFSYYAEALPWPVDKIKEAVDPFTGCFISRIPLTVVYLRFALKAASFFASDDREEQARGLEFILTGAPRLRNAIERFAGEPDTFKKIYEEERAGWDLYYDILNMIEKSLAEHEPFALQMRDRAKAIISASAVRTGSQRD